MRLAVLALALAACGSAHHATGDGGAGRADAPFGPGSGRDAAAPGDGPGGMRDAPGVADAAGAGSDAAADASGGTGVITGGPCASGAPGQAAYRITWIDAGGQAQVEYDVDGLPDHSRDHAGAYGYQIGFTPEFVDPYLGDGGLQLDDSDFVDLEISTAGVATITQATLAIYGRSFDVTTSGSFNWQTFVGTGSSPIDSVSNVAPYQWYSADMTTELAPDDAMTLIRIKAGPSSGVLVVNQIELCLVAS